VGIQERTKGGNEVNNWIGQINRAQARATAIKAIGAGLVAVLGVVATDAPLYVSAATPAGVIIAVVIAQLQTYLASGINPPGGK
jgi:hypothetical protein